VTDSPTSPIWRAVRPIQDELADILGVPAGEVIGAPLAIAFVIRIDENDGTGTDDDERFFLSGLSPDVATAAIETLGSHILPEAPDGSDGLARTLTIVEQVWSAKDAGPSVGFGPVALAPTADPSLFVNPRRLTVVTGQTPVRSRLERAEQLRATFARVSGRLAGEVAPAVDWSILARAEGEAQAWSAEALSAIAVTRRAVGSYLIDQADELDDERVDQLGDGYVRAAELWRCLAEGDWALGPELHELERSCVAWMRSAADRPTRYAF